MVTSKEWAAARTFNRRRVLAAFLGGARRDGEVEGVHPGRAVLAGLGLTALVLGAAAASTLMHERPDTGWWQQNSFVVARETGEQFVVRRGGDEGSAVLQSVPNFVSAQLVLGTSAPKAFSVPQAERLRVTRGADLGIVGAPERLPDAAHLVNGGWVACTAGGRGTHVSLRSDPAVVARPRGAFVVRDGDGTRWLLTEGAPGEGRRYRLPPGDRGATFSDRMHFPAGILDRLAVVDPGWLALFEEGTDLSVEAFALERIGSPVGQSGLSGHRVGDLIRTPHGWFLLGGERPRRLDRFAATLYEALGHGSATVHDAALTVPAAPAGTPGDWPEELPVAGRDEGSQCAVLTTASTDREGSVSTVAVRRSPATAPRRGEVVLDIPAEAGALIRVAAGRGAGHDAGWWAVDGHGTRHRLQGPDVLESLGWKRVSVPLVPAPWADLFEVGVPLSVEAARAPREP